MQFAHKVPLFMGVSDQWHYIMCGNSNKKSDHFIMKCAVCSAVCQWYRRGECGRATVRSQWRHLSEEDSDVCSFVVAQSILLLLPSVLRYLLVCTESLKLLSDLSEDGNLWTAQS